MAMLRSPKTEAAYRAYIAAGGLADGCRLCDAPALESFTHWKVVDNIFPYDAIAKTHHMLVPLAHRLERELSDGERTELIDLKESSLNRKYDVFIEASRKLKTIPAHFHLHLVELAG